MMGLKFMGIFTVVPVTIFLTIGFFVQLAMRKLDSKALRKFGLVILGLLWFCAALYLTIGVYSMSVGKCPTMYKMYKMMPAPMYR